MRRIFQLFWMCGVFWAKTDLKLSEKNLIRQICSQKNQFQTEKKDNSTNFFHSISGTKRPFIHDYHSDKILLSYKFPLKEKRTETNGRGCLYWKYYFLNGQVSHPFICVWISKFSSSSFFFINLNILKKKLMCHKLNIIRVDQKTCRVLEKFLS